MEIIESANGNRYFYEPSTGYISICPLQKDTITNGDISHNKKVSYLIARNLIQTQNENCIKYRALRKDDIENAILNTHQIIFEVTDRCNLDCYYCGYGELYDNHDERHTSNMNFDTFKTLYDYLKNLWETSSNKGCSYLRISFYGGEPLCNFPLIEAAVEYTKKNPIRNKNILYSMTTNGVLLNKYMPFLAEHDFQLLLSLDGDAESDSYRTFHNGKASFETVVSNIDKLANSFPLYFAKSVKINSVLHNRNSINKIEKFIYSRYGKHPLISELNMFGIAKSKRHEFWKLYKSKTQDFKNLTENEKRNLRHHSSYYTAYQKWLFESLTTVYQDSLTNVLTEEYVTTKRSKQPILPTKTCIPFDRKIFVTVNGKLYPCERIGNEFRFGVISDHTVSIDYDNIITTYNQLFEKYIGSCLKCKIKDFCSVCVVSDIEGYKNCNKYSTAETSSIFAFFENYPESLNYIIKNVDVL